jgi:hypothetical protein
MLSPAFDGAISARTRAHSSRRRIRVPMYRIGHMSDLLLIAESGDYDQSIDAASSHPRRASRGFPASGTDVGENFS